MMTSLLDRALDHHFRLSATECLLADVISTLSRQSGWCFASREYLDGFVSM